MPLIKYTPQFVERQYVPTDINLLANAMGTKQNQFDAASNLANAQVEQLYGMDVTPGFAEGRNTIVEGLKNRISEAISNRGGDAGAALSDIKSIVTGLKKDPFFQYSKIASEKAKELQQQIARNPNLFVLKDSRGVKWHPGMTEDELNYSVLDPEEVRKIAQVDYAGEAGKRFLGIGTDPSGRYDMAKFQYGPTEQRISQILNNPKSIERLKQYYPQTAGMSSENLDKFFRGALESTLRSMQKPEDVDIIGKNEEYLAKLAMAKKGAIGYNPLLSFGDETVVPENLDSAYQANKHLIDDKIANEAKSYGLDKVSNLNDLKKKMDVSEIYSKKPLADLSDPNKITAIEAMKSTQSTRKLPGIDMSDPNKQVALKTMQSMYGNEKENKIRIEEAKKASVLYNKIMSDVSYNPERYAYKTLNLNALASADPDNITANTKIIKNFNDVVSKNINKFEFQSDEDKDLYEKIDTKKGLEVTDIIPLFGRGASPLGIIFQGEDKDGNPIQVRKYLTKDPSVQGASSFENQIYGYLEQLPGVGANLARARYMRDPRNKKQLNAAIENLASSQNPEYIKFIKDYFPEYITK